MYDVFCGRVGYELHLYSYAFFFSGMLYIQWLN